MTIKDIQQTASRVGRLRLVFDSGKSMMVYPSVLADLSLYPGQELSREEYETLLDTAGLASAKNRALRIISLSGVSEGDLRRRLREKGESAAHAEAAVDWLRELELLDDRKTAQQIVSSGLRKGYGEQRLRQMLYEKQIPREYWQEALDQLPDPEEAIEAYLAKAFSGRQADEKLVRKTTDALIRRGYRYAQVRQAIRHYLDGLDQTDCEETIWDTP